MFQWVGFKFEIKHTHTHTHTEVDLDKRGKWYLGNDVAITVYYYSLYANLVC